MHIILKNKNKSFESDLEEIRLLELSVYCIKRADLKQHIKI